MRITVLILTLMGGCGDDLGKCTMYYSADQTCYAAQIFASRDTVDIVPSESNIIRYEERWRAVVEAEPLLHNRHPQTYRDDPPSIVSLKTTNRAAVSAWQDQNVVTGDAQLDEVVGKLEPTAIEAFHSHPGGTDDAWLFTIDVPLTYSEQNLSSALEPTGTTMSDPTPLPRDDGVWTWMDDVAQIDFKVGFGDCFVACSSFRQLRAIVQSDMKTTVFDLGGDPLPFGVSLSPNTLPP